MLQEKRQAMEDVGEPLLSISVLVPTWRRPEDLRRCLEALARQIRPADEVLVIVRDVDVETRGLLDDLRSGPDGIRIVDASGPGVVSALNHGLGMASGDIVAFLDDDAAPRQDWLQRIAAHYQSDSTLGGVGGRDVLHAGDEPENRSATVVGKIQWFGRMIGNHHLGVGAARKVDHLKGVNMSFRRKAIGEIRFDSRLKGSGAQVGNETAFGLAIGRAGWPLVYDPEILVDHYHGIRHDYDKRTLFDDQACFDAAYNDTVILLDHLPLFRRIAFVLWAFAIGLRVLPGPGQWVRLLIRGEPHANRRLWATLRGRAAGVRDWLRDWPEPDEPGPAGSAEK